MSYRITDISAATVGARNVEKVRAAMAEPTRAERLMNGGNGGALSRPFLDAPLPAQKTAKYHNITCVIDGHEFDSKSEGKRYTQLKAMQAAGTIRDLEIQPAYELRANGGDVIGTYTADFRYVRCSSGETVVEDVKSKATRTPLYMRNRRHMEAEHGIKIHEVIVK